MFFLQGFSARKQTIGAVNGTASRDNFIQHLSRIRIALCRTWPHHYGMPSGIPNDPRKRSGPGRYNWKGDTASTQTKRHRAKRLYPLKDCERCGVPATDRHHKDGNTGNNSPGNIARLCRRCHMVEDGRLERFKESARRNGALRKQPPKPCINCGVLAKPRRKKLCHRCADYFGRTGRKRPAVTGLLKGGPPMSKESPCPNCGRITRLKSKGRCVVCYNYWKLNGKDRDKASFKVSELSQTNRNERRLRTGK